MNYKCLILDHDDTVVDSTATVHYPAFVAFMEQLRGGTDITLEQYFTYNFSPGVLPFFQEIIGLNEAEMKAEEAFWREFVRDHVPRAYPEMKKLMWQARRAGSLLCVVSHSFSDYVRRDYEANGLPEPDMLFGWEVPKDIRKPEPHSVRAILERFSLRPEEGLVVDDLKPGFDMARAAGVPFAAAGWAGEYPEVEAYMRANCEQYCRTIEDLAALIGLNC
jgi:phosphoglycolate phosphatase/pyrophosphatase PpaX